MLVLGDIGEMREMCEGADHLDGAVARQAVQGGDQFGARGFVIVASELDRNLADALHRGEDRVSLLLANGLAEDSAEQPDVLAERQIAFWYVDDVHGRLAAELDLCKSVERVRRTVDAYPRLDWSGAP